MMSARTTVKKFSALVFAVAIGLVLVTAPAESATKKPTLSKITPTTGPLSGGTKVTLTGTYFTRGSTVTFGTRSASVQYSSSKKIYATAPAGVAGSVSVKVKTSGGTSTSKTFSYRVKPWISAVAPDRGKISGGNKVTIRGGSFVSPTTVTFDGTAVAATVVSSTQLTVTTPRHDDGQAPVVVANKYGTSDPSLYTYETAATTATDLKVGSFNVRVASASENPSTSYEKSWKTRLPVVAAQLKAADVDVAGIQEASASTKYTAGGVAQFMDVLDALGAPYALTSSERYCKSIDSAGDCVAGASSSDRIIYNTDRLALVRQGARKLDTRAWDDGSGRYVTWAVLQDRITGKQFFFVSTHLEPGTSGTTRKQQVATILDEITTHNSANLPVVVVGDLGSTKFDKESVGGRYNIAHEAFIDAGFADPLVNSYKYQGSSLALHNINEKYSSLNYFAASPQLVAGTYPIGSYIDYIMTRGGDVEYDTWETVLDLNSSGEFNGVIPSDHNLITLSMTLS